MSLIDHYFKHALRNAVYFLNQSGVKEGVKNCTGGVTFVIGLIETYDCYEILKGRRISTTIEIDSPRWCQVADKISLISAKLSLILSAVVSRPGRYLISTLVGRIVSKDRLDFIFGPNINFAGNPWHPRHVVSIAAILLAVPSTVQLTYKEGRLIYMKLFKLYQTPSIHLSNDRIGLTDHKVRLLNLFNIITSRPVLHIGNFFFRKFRF
jgi:hypothetical protein